MKDVDGRLFSQAALKESQILTDKSCIRGEIMNWGHFPILLPLLSPQPRGSIPMAAHRQRAWVVFRAEFVPQGCRICSILKTDCFCLTYSSSTCTQPEFGLNTFMVWNQRLLCSFLDKKLQPSKMWGFFNHLLGDWYLGYFLSVRKSPGNGLVT